MLWGGIAVPGKPLRLPRTIAATIAATPALMWTTVPPAKSMKPMSPSQPPPQTQWHTGAYTSNSHREENHSTAENFMRSAKPPTIRAGVMMANVIWNMKNTVSGISPLMLSQPTPSRKNLPMPTNLFMPPPSPNARP